jgi:DNA-binding transcriptional MerR regulator
VEYSIQQVAKAAGVSSRTLRHYDAIGLLPARRVRSGYRVYSGDDLVRLQRILLLRELGLPLSEMTSLLARPDLGALEQHRQSLQEQRQRLSRQIASVERTIHALRTKGTLMIDDVFDGFDHTQYREEVEQKWGAQAYADSDAWWRGLDDADKRGFTAEHAEIAQAWNEARQSGLAPDSAQVSQIAARHAGWIARGWAGRTPSPQALVALAQMYIADERFARNYGGADGAAYVRDGLVAYADRL